MIRNTTAAFLLAAALVAVPASAAHANDPERCDLFIVQPLVQTLADERDAAQDEADRLAAKVQRLQDRLARVRARH